MHSLFCAATVLASTLPLTLATGFDASSNTKLAVSSPMLYRSTHDDSSMTATMTASPSASPQSCGTRGFDISPAYNFLNDTTIATFDKCSVRCSADSACVSFAIGYSQCLLYNLAVASNVNENANSPFTFYDKYCALPSAVISSISSSSIHPHSKSSDGMMASLTHETQSTVSKATSSSDYASGRTSSHSSVSSSKAVSSSSSEAHPTGKMSNHPSEYTSSTESKSSTSSEFQPYPTKSGTALSSSHSVSVVSPHVTPATVHSPSEIPTKSKETMTSYVDVTITSCPPEVTDCPTKTNAVTSALSPISSTSVNHVSYPSSSSRVVPEPGSLSSPSSQSAVSPTGPAPTHPVKTLESYTTVITTHYVGICPTGYTTIPYTTTAVTVSGPSDTHAPSSEVPAGFTTTAVVCPACNSASPTVTLTVPVVSVLPVPVVTGSPAAGYPSVVSPPAAFPSASYPSASYPPAGSSLGASPPAASHLAGASSGGSNPTGYTSFSPASKTSSAGPAGYTPSPSAPPNPSAPSVTRMSSKISPSGPASNAVPTVATPRYNAINGTMLTSMTGPASAGTVTKGASSGLSGAEVTRPASFTGGARTLTLSTFVAVVITSVWAGLLIM